MRISLAKKISICVIGVIVLALSSSVLALLTSRRVEEFLWQAAIDGARVDGDFPIDKQCPIAHDDGDKCKHTRREQQHRTEQQPHPTLPTAVADETH